MSKALPVLSSLRDGDGDGLDETRLYSWARDVMGMVMVRMVMVRDDGDG